MKTFQPGQRITVGNGTTHTVVKMADRIGNEPQRVEVEGGAQWLADDCDTAPPAVNLSDTMKAVIRADVSHPDATDLAHADDPTYDQCPRCTHLWPLDEMSRDRNGDNICPDCVFPWAAYPDHR